jgi:uncharacterized protein
MNGRCSVYFVVEADGGIYPCDFYVTDKWKLGNIREDSFSELEKSARAQEFVAASAALSDECPKCEYYYLCRGGCKRDREEIDSGKYVNYYCSAYKAFFKHSTDGLREIAGMDRHPYGL